MKSYLVRHNGCRTIASLLAVSICAFAGPAVIAAPAAEATATVSTTARSTPIDSNKIVPQYPVVYQIPTQDEITQQLLRVLGKAEIMNPAIVEDRRTHQPITDFSTPNPNATVNMGSYPVGVLHSGMLAAGQATGDRRFTDFTAKRFQLIADRLPYFKAQAEKSGGVARSSFRNFMDPNSLDACGAWGIAMIKANREGVGPDLRPVINLYADYISHKQFRLPDGTLARTRPQKQSLWADDMYMGIPFLAEMGKLTGDNSYYDDAVKQVLGFSSRIFIAQRGLFAHGWGANNPDFNPDFYWGRANGWCIMAIVEVLDVLPDNYHDRGKLITILREHAQALANLQAGDGLWHQLLDKTDSYTESSCSAMFIYSMARAVNRGWIDAASYAPVAISGWDALSARIRPDGGIDGTCVGTSYASDALYYYHRPNIDDIHGYGPTLLAGSEIIQLLNNKQLKIGVSQYGPITVVDSRAPANAANPGS